MSGERADTPAGRPGASQLLRALGLLVDGPVRWGEPAPSRSPGVFVVELPDAAAEPVFDQAALRRWLERVPELRLDGEQPTVGQLAQRLADFWLPAEPVLYVGRSAKSIGGRVAALYATELGDARPHPGGHWLKTLDRLNRLLIWWAETDAHEEAEDALLDAVAARHAGDDTGGEPLLPFANLQDAGGRARAHGLTASLRAATAADSAARSAASPSTAGPQRRAAAGRSSQRTGATASRARAASSRPPKAPPKPAAEPTYLSREGLDRLQVELDELRNAVRPVVIERVKTARELGDLRENAEYESARKEQSFVEGRIQALEQMIRSAVIVAAEPAGDTIVIGSTVTVETDGQSEAFAIVGSSEADPAAGRISYASPVGQALLGRRVGDEVAVKLPRGEVRYVVRGVA